MPLDDGRMIGVQRWDEGATSAGGQGQPVGTFECLNPLSDDVHIHAHLSIFLNGEALAIPREIGIVTTGSSRCLYGIHTHDATGMLHLEGLSGSTFALGDFFAIWGQPLERDNVAGLMGMPVVVYVTDDGVVSEYTGDMAELELTSRRLITIQVGTPITEVPNYTWSGD